MKLPDMVSYDYRQGTRKPCEIFAHAYVYYNFRFVPKFLQGVKIFKSLYRSVANGVDLEDNGDKWYRRIAYRFIWVLPAL